MTDLQDIDGVGPSYAEQLDDAGYETVQDVAEADTGAIDDLLTSLDGGEVIDSARDEIDADFDETSPNESEAGFGTDGFEPGFDDDQRNHLIRALVTQEVRARRRNDPGRANAIGAAIDELIDGEPYDLSLEQLDAAYTGINQLEAEYRGTRGLGSFTTKIRNARDTIKDARSQFWDS